MIAVSLVTLTFLVPGFFMFGPMASRTSRATWSNPLFLVFLLAFYLAQYTVIFFCNTALVGAAMIRLDGGDPSVSDGFRIASERIGKIVAYAFISATVGMFFRWLSEKGLLGRIVAGLIGVTWNIATYLVVPVLVVEDVGPIEAIKRSAALAPPELGRTNRRACGHQRRVRIHHAGHHAGGRASDDRRHRPQVSRVDRRCSAGVDCHPDGDGLAVVGVERHLYRRRVSIRDEWRSGRILRWIWWLRPSVRSNGWCWSSEGILQTKGLPKVTAREECLFTQSQWTCAAWAQVRSN